ncbi:hypothetical protein [Microbulbifer guangxiensis]|uniref:hypothetical protein n=1 Tax=Microbulbifer guangxiensis TaxID=2904249 RepID=UPI001F1F6D79|nr:hypothetical protein [Microbulbifer guangxiensis]
MKIKTEEEYIRATGSLLSLCKQERTTEEETQYIELWHSISEYEDNTFNMSALTDIIKERHLYGPLPGDEDYPDPPSLKEWEWNLCRLEDRAHYIASLNSDVD